MNALPPVRTPLRQRLADLGRGPLALAVWLGAAGLCVWLLGRRAERGDIVGLARALEYEVSSPLNGRVEQVLIDLLDEVEAGQELALLESAGLEARIETLAAGVSALRAELEAERARLAAEERAAQGERLSELRRFAGDEEELRLEALAIAVQLESDRVERQRLELRETRLQTLVAQGVSTQEELDDARLMHERFDVQVRENELLLGETRATLALAQRRREEFQRGEPATPPAAPTLAALRERIRAEELLLREIEVERAGLVLRAPARSVVRALLASPGQALTPGEPVALLAASFSPEVLAYLPEQSQLTVQPGDRVRVSMLRPPWRITECLVVKCGSGVELLPERLWRDVNTPEYGLPVVARGSQVLELLPGERVAVRFAD